jgi:hypothetical protein
VSDRLTVTAQLTKKPTDFGRWHGACCVVGMIRKLKRLFTIKTKFEAFLLIYALALGAADRGVIYMMQYPGIGGKLLALCCTGAVFMAGGKILDAVEMQAELGYFD